MAAPFLKDRGIDFVIKVRKNRKPVTLDSFDQRCYGSDPSSKPSSTN
jgi:hypothetical protein